MGSTSFRQGSLALDELADLAVGAKQVERVVRRIGAERCAQRDADVEAFLQLPLVEKSQAPPGVSPPELAVVMADGARMQILDRSRQQSDDAAPARPRPEEGTRAAGAGSTAAGGRPDRAPDLSPATAAALPPTPADGDESEEAPVSEPGSKGKHWREDKVAVLMSMSSPQGREDPCPDIPSHFVNAARIDKLVRALKAKAKTADTSAQSGAAAEKDAAEEKADAEKKADAEEKAAWDPPAVKQRKVVASRQNWKSFGPILAAAAWSLGFFAAPRRAFVGDGSTHHWGVWRRHFPTFEPILDFIHALSYVYAAALAGRSALAGWPVYVHWIGWVWQGEVSRVIEALRQRQQAVGVPSKEDKESSPRRVVQEALTYLSNHQGQMKYSDYRRDGLPITSSHIESEIKRINQRVKGTEKFWSEEGAEWILQLRADYLSDDKPMDAFWQKRQAEETGQRRYRKTA
jgi:hypothetical protein